MQKLLNEYLNDGSERVGWTASTVSAYSSHIVGFLRWLAGRHGRPADVADYTAVLLQTYDTARKRANIKQRSRSAAVCAWQSFARYLVERKHITQEECAAIAKLQVRITEKSKQRWATAAQVVDLFAAAERVGDYHGDALCYRGALCQAVLAVMAYGGLRRGEVVGLMIADVKLEADMPVMTVKGKGEKIRDVYLHPNAVAHLRRWLEFRTDGGDHMFVLPIYHHERPPSVAQITKNRVVGILAELCRLAEISTEMVLTPHAFRRFAASNLLKVPGCTIIHVRDFLGHSSVATTIKYLGVETQELQQFIVAMKVEPVVVVPVALPEPPPQNERIRRATPTHRRAVRRW